MKRKDWMGREAAKEEPKATEKSKAEPAPKKTHRYVLDAATGKPASKKGREDE